MANVMTKRGSLDNVVTYEHFCDEHEDLANIPQNQITLGSIAVVLNDEEDAFGVYIANSNKEWVNFTAMLDNGGGSSGGGGGTVIGNADWLATSNQAGYIDNKPSILAGTGNRAIYGNSTVNKASGVYSTAFGNNTKASGDYAFAEGDGTQASARASHAEGYDTIASGLYSHAEGRSTRALRGQSHSEGVYTLAFGDSSHAEGTTTSALGTGAHSEGHATLALGAFSHTEGSETCSFKNDQHVGGRFNLPGGNYPPEWHPGYSYQIGDIVCNYQYGLADIYVCVAPTDDVQFNYDAWEQVISSLPLNSGDDPYLEIIGNGVFGNRHNARTLDEDGNAWYAGNLAISGGTLTIGNTSITEIQLQELLSISLASGVSF